MRESNWMKIPREIECALNFLNKSMVFTDREGNEEQFDGEAYIVGGCIRDAILGREPHDWDICTSLEPDKLKRKLNILYKGEGKFIDTGLKHGTVTAFLDGYGYCEITTFRSDGDYSDGRHPDKVLFVKNIESDLERRDFTMNAIAYNPYRGFVDPFGGIKDIDKGVIRCVGNPNKRFSEDALRIMRAWRFQCQLGFSIEENTLAIMLKQKHLSSLFVNVSAERKREEFLKAFEHTDNFIKSMMGVGQSIMSVILPEWEDVVGFDQNNKYHIYTVDEHILSVLKYCEDCDLITRLSAFLHDLGKPSCYTEDVDGNGHFYGHPKMSALIANKFMLNLRFDNETREKVVQLVANHDVELAPTKRSVKRLLNKLGEEQMRRLMSLKKADMMSHNPKYNESRMDDLYKAEELLNEVLSESECFSLRDLDIDGHDLIEIGFKTGKHLGVVLNTLLDDVISEKLENTKEVLLERAKEMLE